MRAWRSFLEAHKYLMDTLGRELDERDLPLTWYDVLVQLNEAEDHRLRMSELAEAILVSRSGLTRLVDRMTAEDLVERIACPDDGRGTFVGLTAKGKHSLERAAPGHLRGIQEHFGRHLTDEEARALHSVFERIRTASVPVPTT